MARRPAVAGAFYEADTQALISSIEQCFTSRFGPGQLPSPKRKRLGKVVGLVCPHAGYVYSGAAAAHSYKALAVDGLPETVVLLGPNHTGLGETVAVAAEDGWVTPLGTLPVDRGIADEILRQSTYARSDDVAHSREHSIEVQLPFLQYLMKRASPSPQPSPASGEGADPAGSPPAGERAGMSIVPICIAHLPEDDALMLASDLGGAIAGALAGKSAVVIASTDFTHYESKTSAQAKDSVAMEHILNRDAPGLIAAVYDRHITMCGVVGTAVMLEACKEMGAAKARKLAYYTSGDVIGDTSQVVGYGALSVEL